MRIICFLIAMFLSGISASYAQSVGPATLNSSGGYATAGGSTFEWSFGEMTAVHTSSAANIIVTQGVLQPLANPSGIITAKYADAAVLKVYPVPTQNVVYLQPAFNTGGTLQYSLLDATGKSILKQSVGLKSGTEQQSIDMTVLPPGNYMLQVQYADTNVPYSNVYKIQKIQ
jgi:hypothetical protein